MTKTKLKFCMASCFALLLLPANNAHSINLDRSIEELKVEGLKRAEENTVRYYIKSEKGQKYSAKTVQEDIRRLYKLGYFDNIVIDAQELKYGLSITYQFTEKPFVSSIIFSGTDAVKEDILSARVRTKKGAFFRQGLLPWDKLRIKQVYRDKGYYFSEVETVVKRLKDNQVDVEYRIVEGKKITISDIRFVGNIIFSDRALSDQIESSDVGMFSFLSDSGAYKKDVVKTDILRIESFYHDNGYIKVKVAEPLVEIDKEGGGIVITFTVDEGDLYHVGEINVEGDEVYSADEILAAIDFSPGDVFNRSVFRKNIFTVTDLYSQKGYAYANVVPSMKINEETKVVDTTITTKKGRRVYVGKINIHGNEDTQDKVIRRKFLLHEGELFNSEKLRISKQQVQRLGFFESVDIEQRSHKDPDLINIDVNVLERNTGQLSFAVGYSSLEKLLLEGQVKWSNLMGAGQELSFTVDYSELRNDYSISFTDQALFDRPLLGGMELYNKTYEFDAYESKRTGWSLKSGRALGINLWAKLGYRYEEGKVTIIDADEASTYLKAQEGASISGSIFPSLTYDTRNDRFNPSSGYRLYGYYEIAGIVGDERYFKAIGEYSYYKHLYSSFVGMFHAKIGLAQAYDDQDLPITRRFFLGGPTSLRGFTINDIGPQDENGDVIGGEGLLLFNVELQYRFTDFFRGFLFYDRGNVYGGDDAKGNTTEQMYDLSEMRDAIGFGLHFFSPMGPITIAYGFKVDKKEDETDSEFHFTIGGAF